MIERELLMVNPIYRHPIIHNPAAGSFQQSILGSLGNMARYQQQITGNVIGLESAREIVKTEEEKYMDTKWQEEKDAESQIKMERGLLKAKRDEKIEILQAELMVLFLQVVKGLVIVAGGSLALGMVRVLWASL